MSKERLLFIIGLIMAIIPLSGFPTSWKKFLISIGGLAVIYLAYVLYKEKKKSLPKKDRVEVYTENRDFIDEHQNKF
jgi:hypothetical protein